MPVYFLIAMPFYFIGELNILSVAGYILLIILIKRSSGSHADKGFLLIYLITSSFAYWEIAVRSNVLTYTVLTLLVLVFAEKKLRLGGGGFIIPAILSGLMLSTRSVYIMPYIIYFFPILFQRKIRPGSFFVFSGIAILSFLLSFVPFIVFFPDEFCQMNPFIIQSTFLVPLSYTVIFISITIVLSFFVKNSHAKFFYSGLSLFIGVLIYSLYHISRVGLEWAFMQSKIDISYFIFCIPFLMLYLIGEQDTEKI